MGEDEAGAPLAAGRRAGRGRRGPRGGRGGRPRRPASRGRGPRRPPGAGEEPRGRRAADPAPHRRLGDRPERASRRRGRRGRRSSAPRSPAEEPDLVPEEGGLGAAQRGRRDGGADRAVGEAEDVPGLHVPLLAVAGRPAPEAVGGRRGDAGARVGDAQDVPLVADREDGPLGALGVAQDEPPGGGLDRPDEPSRRDAEGRLEPAPRRRRRGRAESLEREEGRRAEAERGESAGAERGWEDDTGGRQHRRRGASPCRTVVRPLPHCGATP